VPFTVSTRTDSFRRPELSEDRLAVHHVPGGLVVVVADGAGGTAGGGPAADLVLKVVAEAIAQPGFTPFTPAAWTELLIRADALVVRDRVAGEATCVVVAVRDDGRIVGASVGDSGAIVVGVDGRIDELTEGQHRKRRLGGGRAAPVLFERRSLDGVLVIATDGLFNYARPEVIAQAVATHQDLDTTAQALVQVVRLPSGSFMDDVAVAVVGT
jgi:serine/threonine protein phosphatase PrpC